MNTKLLSPQTIAPFVPTLIFLGYVLQKFQTFKEYVGMLNLNYHADFLKAVGV